MSAAQVGWWGSGVRGEALAGGASWPGSFFLLSVLWQTGAWHHSLCVSVTAPLGP